MTDRNNTIRVISLVGIAHLISHFYMMILPPILPILQADFGVSYAALGLAISLFGLSSAVLQVPVGMIVDKIGAGPILIAALAAQGFIIILIGLIPTYPALLVLMTLSGVANAAYHPADFALLSNQVGEGKHGRAFGIHAFMGNLGWAVAPPFMAGIAVAASWQWAMIGAGLLGILFAIFMLFQPVIRDARAAAHDAGGPKPALDHKKLFLSAPILMCFLTWVLIGFSDTGIRGYAVTIYEQIGALSLAEANTALTGYLIASAIGVLVGGQLADKYGRHALTASLAALGAAMMIYLAITLTGSTLLVLALLSLAGFLWGIISPSRDMIVKEAAPRAATGTVFGFVSTGLSLASLIAAPAFGYMLDEGFPREVFYISSVMMLLTIVSILGVRSKS